MPPSPFAHQIDAYLDGPAQLRRVVADLNPQQLEARPVPGKWSTLEVVCHLVDSEQAWCHRMKRVIAEERPLLIGYDESRFTASSRRLSISDGAGAVNHRVLACRREQPSILVGHRSRW